MGFQSFTYFFPGVSGRKTLSWSEVDSLMHLYNATFFLNKKENRNTLPSFPWKKERRSSRAKREMFQLDIVVLLKKREREIFKRTEGEEKRRAKEKGENGRQKALNDNGELARTLSLEPVENQHSIKFGHPTHFRRSCRFRREPKARCRLQSLSAPWKFIVGSAEPELARAILSGRRRSPID